MMKKGLLLITFLLLFIVTPSSAQVRVGFLYKLSDFTGTIPYTHPRIVIDETHNEIYVLFQNQIKVFNENGMEIYSFGDDLQVGLIADIAVREDGDIILLCYDGEYRLVLCNYRGEPISDFKLKGLPESFSSFKPSRIIRKKDRLYFGALKDFKVVVTDQEGNYIDGYDFPSIIGLTEKELAENEIVGFNISDEGDLLLTIPTLFKVYRITPDRKVFSFGKPGGAPGMFGVISGIAMDSRGNYLVADKLKDLVHIFDRNGIYITEFGYRGEHAGALFNPDGIQIDGKNRVFISQGRRAGVSVFLLTYD